MREIVSPLSGIRSPFGPVTSLLAMYAVLGFKPQLAFDFDDERYFTGSRKSTFSDAITHSATSNATMVDSDGLLKWRPHNLLTYSEQFDNAAWVLSPLGTGTVTKSTANAASAPDGTVTADRVLFNLNGGTTSSDIALIRQANSEVGAVTHSIWVRSFDGVSTYTMQIILPDGNGQNITVTGKWQRFEVSGISAASVNYGIRLRGGQSPANSDSADVLLWGAHLYRSDLGGMVNNPDRGDSYVPTTSAAVYLPRRGHHVYNGSEWVNEGVLHESEARTNLITYSEDFTGWTNSNTTDALNAVGPDGQTSATTITNSASGNSLMSLSAVQPTGTQTLSLFVKAGTSSTVTIVAQNSGLTNNARATLTFSSLTVASAVSGTGYTLLDSGVEDHGSGWYRLWLTYSLAAGVTDTLRLYAGNFASVVSGETVVVYGAQLEAGSTPSSYIPTNSGATVTRAAETLTIPAANLPWPSPVYVTGEELVTNGTFDADISGWSAGNSATLSAVSGLMRVTNAGASYGYAYQAFSTEIGKVYKVSVDVIYNTGFARLLIANSPTETSFSNINVDISGTYTYTFVATATTTYVNVGNRNDLGVYNDFDNISVKEINPLSVSIQMQGEVTSYDSDSSSNVVLLRWFDTSSNSIQSWLQANGTRANDYAALQWSGGVLDVSLEATGTGIGFGQNVPFNIASRHGSTFVNGAVDGVALTASTTPVALPDLSSTDLQLGFDFNGTIKQFRIWANDLGDTGIAEASA